MNTFDEHWPKTFNIKYQLISKIKITEEKISIPKK